ncbi:MAG: glycosyltransferase family 4 protein [Acidobacteriota bacterium]
MPIRLRHGVLAPSIRSAVRTALALLRPGAGTSPATHDPRDDSAPRGFLFEDMFDHVWDQHLVGDDSAGPAWLRLAREVYRRRDDYDVILTWGERLTLSLLTLQQLFGAGKPHLAIISQFSKPNIDLPMRVLGKHLHAAIAFSSVQRDFARQRGYLGDDRLYLVRYAIDAQFYRPQPGREDVICAVGAEMRDYPTLFAALEGTELPCHVAADRVRVPGRLRLIKDRRVRVQDLLVRPNPHLTIERKSLLELRDLYARSRFVVVPLLQSQSDNGITVILEAMAMGKAVICTATAGQVDVIEDGVTGLFVPVGDAAALRAAMVGLWNDPERARAIGARARARIERHHTLERFCTNVSAAIATSMAGESAPPGEWWEVPDPGLRA